MLFSQKMNTLYWNARRAFDFELTCSFEFTSRTKVKKYRIRGKTCMYILNTREINILRHRMLSR